MSGTVNDIEKLETHLWEAADNLRANSKLTSNDYFMPVLGVIFLRHAANRFAMVSRQIEQEQVTGQMPQRKVIRADYVRRRALWLPEQARYDWIMQQAATSGQDLAALVTDAMVAIEDDFDPLKGVLPKDFGIFEATVLEDLMRLFNSDQIRNATGDVFGRIYEYFLAKFSMQKAHDNGEFFTPPSIVQTIVNVIEPDHGAIFDPACGSGGMFVQSSHFIELQGGDTAKKVVFYGQEKNPDTIRIAQMNLAVHGLEGKIAEAITYYQDEHGLVAKCNFVMANPPFNVDLVDAERIKNDLRLPFSLPGVNKQKRVSNANYLWISYFWSYLNEHGRAGFVMSSQASSAGHGEKDVRKKIVESGDVDVMISIRSNFFYTRTVPCELWFFDRSKPVEHHDTVLMLDARNIFRKVSRKINDFSPEQTQNLAAIIWLYRNQKGRFLALIRSYFDRLCAENETVPAAITVFDETLTDLRGRFKRLAHNLTESGSANGTSVADSSGAAFSEAVAELEHAATPYQADADKLTAALQAYNAQYQEANLDVNESQHSARLAYDPHAEAIRGLIKQVDLLHRLTAQAAATARDAATDRIGPEVFDRRTVGRLLRQLEANRRSAVEQLKHVVYFHRQVMWLQERFPDAELRAVPGLVRLVSRSEIAASGWSLSPSRYVGVAPPDAAEDFDFEQVLSDIHTELADLNAEAVKLSARIQGNLEELGA